MDHGHDHQQPLSSASEWDARYGEDPDRIWSGHPNPSLIAEVAQLRPGRAMDLGCGEGADAIWLASRGWTVTAVDISRVAIDRATRAATAEGVEVTWRCIDYIDAPPPRSAFDLVTTHYPAIPVDRADRAIPAMLDAVAPGGTLLFVWHEVSDPSVALAHGFDPDDYLRAVDVVEHLGEGWTIVTNEARDRPTMGEATSPHAKDVVLRAVRTSR